MSKINKGELVEIVENRCGHHFNIGDIVEVISYDDRTGVYKVSNSDDEWNVVIHEIKPINQYKQSNRYKLSQFIKAQSYKAIELSVAIGHQATYLSSTASKSRFESRGDISDSQLHKIANEVNNKVLELKSAEEHSEDLKNEKALPKLKIDYSNAQNFDKKLDLPDFKFNQPTQALSEIKTPSIHGTVKALPDLDSHTPIQRRESKSIKVSKKAVWFTVFLITVLIVSLLATLIYLA